MTAEWEVLWHSFFEERFMSLLERVEELARTNPDDFYNHPDYKFFDSVSNCIQNRILLAPGDKEFNLGNTLGKTHKKWRRAKNGLPNRYRLFFRYSSQSKEIILSWLNDEKSIRRDGHKNDVYEVFKRMLASGNMPHSYEELAKVPNESNFTERFGNQ